MNLKEPLFILTGFVLGTSFSLILKEISRGMNIKEYDAKKALKNKKEEATKHESNEFMTSKNKIDKIESINIPLWNVLKSKVNPMDYLKVQGAREFSEAQRIAEMICDPVEYDAKSLEIWKKTSHDFILGLILHTLHTPTSEGKEKEQNKNS